MTVGSPVRVVYVGRAVGDVVPAEPLWLQGRQLGSAADRPPGRLLCVPH